MLDLLYVGHLYYFTIWSKMGPYSGTLAYVYRMFIFHSNLIQLFFNLFNWLDRELFVECLQISSLSYGFGDQLNKTDFES
jgi:hypothetical protein